MRGDSMLFFNKKLKYLVFENDNFNEIVKIDEIVSISKILSNNKYEIIFLYKNGKSHAYDCFSEEVCNKTYEKIKNILIN